jgi:hypothetical protein
MAVEMLGGASESTFEPLIIGDSGAPAVFLCPSCGIPIASAWGKCAGCGTRMLLRTPLRLASTLIALGLAAGLTAGLVVGAGGAALATAFQPAAPMPTAPVAVPGDPGAPGVPGAPPVAGLPAAVSAALRNSGAINGRLAGIEAPLAIEVGRAEVDGSAIARLLRRINTDLGATGGPVTSLSAWEGSSAFGTRLDAFYADLGVAVKSGLDTSTRNRETYRAAARDVLALLAQLPSIEAERLALSGSSATP